jgi:hypothetical protein
MSSRSFGTLADGVMGVGLSGGAGVPVERNAVLGVDVALEERVGLMGGGLLMDNGRDIGSVLLLGLLCLRMHWWVEVVTVLDRHVLNCASNVKKTSQKFHT